jgi:hypothetical protein
MPRDSTGDSRNRQCCFRGGQLAFLNKSTKLPLHISEALLRPSTATLYCHFIVCQFFFVDTHCEMVCNEILANSQGFCQVKNYAYCKYILCVFICCQFCMKILLFPMKNFHNSYGSYLLSFNAQRIKSFPSDTLAIIDGQKLLTIWIHFPILHCNR